MKKELLTLALTVVLSPFALAQHHAGSTPPPPPPPPVIHTPPPPVHYNPPAPSYNPPTIHNPTPVHESPRNEGNGLRPRLYQPDFGRFYNRSGGILQPRILPNGPNNGPSSRGDILVDPDTLPGDAVPPAILRSGDNTVLLTLFTPAEAEVWLNDAPVSPTIGNTRLYQSPPLKPGNYTYEVKVRYRDATGQFVEKVKTITVHPNDKVTVRFGGDPVPVIPARPITIFREGGRKDFSGNQPVNPNIVPRR
jgi:hypothetical protein